MMAPLVFGTLHHCLVSLPDKDVEPPGTARHPRGGGAPITQTMTEKASPEATVYREVKLLTQVTRQDEAAWLLGRLQPCVGGSYTQWGLERERT